MALNTSFSNVSDQVVRVAKPDYNQNNPVQKIQFLIENVHLAAETECYCTEQLQYLFPVEKLTLYGPNQDDTDRDALDFRQQDNKTDFQKQNILDFTTADAYAVRGIVSAESWSGPFLRLSYRGGPDSKLSQAASGRLGETIKLFLRVQGIPVQQQLSVHYNPASDRYDVELWGYAGAPEQLLPQLDAKGKAALNCGEIQLLPGLLYGNDNDFRKESVENRDMTSYEPLHALHPLLPLRIEAAWSDETGTFWDSQNGRNYRYEFSMKHRGWDRYLKVGQSSNPHGGVGTLEYRNLFSNYFEFASSKELGRELEAWNLDGFGTKTGYPRSEPFMTVDYMDLHILRPGCSIGLHRHRDNQEVFFLMEGTAYMAVGDWLQNPDRERCLEVRMLKAGDLVLLKNNQMHSLINTTDENIKLLMFGGYD